MDDILKKFDEITNRVKYNDYIMPFGKYKGQFVADIKECDESYFDWLYEQMQSNEDNYFSELFEALKFHKGE